MISPELIPFDRTEVEILEKTPLYSGFYELYRYRFRHRLFNGEKSQVVSREIMRRDAAVGVLAYDVKRDQVVLIEQIRMGALLQDALPCSPWLLEIIAGLCEEQETIEDVARRESLEEAGVILGRCEFALHCLISPGGTNEVLSLMVAEVDSSTAKGVHGLAQENEDIKVHVVSREQAYEWVKHGNIINAAAIMAIQWLQLNYVRLQQQWMDIQATI